MLQFGNIVKRPIRAYAPSRRVGAESYMQKGLNKSRTSFGGEPAQYSSGKQYVKPERKSLRDRVAGLQAKAMAVRAQRTPISR